MKKFIVILFLPFILIHIGFSFWSTGHALVAEVADQHLDQPTLKKVEFFLKTEPNVPQLNGGKQPSPTPQKLYQSYDYIQAAASWPDDLKQYYWQNYHQKNNFSNMHYIDVDLDLSKQGNQNYCHQTINHQYIEKAVKASTVNVVTGIQSAIKTLATQSTTDHEKATALRYLIHLMGDLAQPLHAGSPVLDGIKTYGGNKIVFDNDNIPSYNQVTGKNPLVDFTSLPIKNMHAYLDSDLAQFNQLQETMDSKYSPDGYELWNKYKAQYLEYLDFLSLQIGQYQYDIPPNLIDWTVQTSKLSCQMFVTDQNSFHYLPNFKNKSIIVVFDPVSFSQYDNSLNRAIFISGIRLAYLLEAIFEPTDQNPKIHLYYEKIVKPIINNPNIPTLDKLSNS